LFLRDKYSRIKGKLASLFEKTFTPGVIYIQVRNMLVMGLPTFDEEGNPRPKRGEYEYLVKDIRGPEKVVSRKKSGVTAAVLQLAFGLVGVGYVYLEERRKAVISSIVFICGAIVIIYAPALCRYCFVCCFRVWIRLVCY
jgi:hypothetical protein